MPGKKIIAELKDDYLAKRPRIVKRLAEFKGTFRRGDRAVFEELCYCILTAGSSAKMGMRTVEALKDILLDGGERDLQERAHAHRVRFWRVRSSYIYHTREHLKDACGLRLCRLLESFETSEARRDYFAMNKAIKGLGFKESSHFLRNVGFPGYAILDLHIVNSLHELGVIGLKRRPANRAEYLEVENKLRAFSRKLGIDMDHLDLLLWSRKTGEILK
jgi:N-glycosylase/DNA lyase